MNRPILGLILSAATVVAAALALVAPAGARPEGGVHVVSGGALLGQLTGGLEGSVVETDETFPSFLATRRITPSGILTWRMPQEFHGCIAVHHCGTLRLDGHFLYRFKPGTTLYDFAGPPAQSGTTGDRDSWLGGGSVTSVVGGDGLEGASGVLFFKETVFLTAQVYTGIIRF